ncbi:MAG: FAD-binding protein [Deltaproteobacteria bacterium]|nr:FAD-binding protein [Deltaproteobacteria bacterium]
MSHAIVLVKQVPDVSKITDNAFDPETGNLMRANLPCVVNELDVQALAFAARMQALQTGSGGRILVLTMGPPAAEEALRFCLARGADQAVLLSDRLLGGADTWATANPLAYAIRRIQRDLLDGSSDVYVVAGMQSVDGDTAQVPAQVAEELQVPCVAYATDVERVDDRLRFTRIISGGRQIVAPLRMPAVITVASYAFPLYPTVARTRWAQRAEVVRWGAADVQARSIGSKGSKTTVIRVFPPPKTSRRCEDARDAAGLARALETSRQVTNAPTARSNRRYVLPRHRADPLDRSFEGLEKQVQAFKDLARILRDRGATDLASIPTDVREQVHGELDASVGKAAVEGMMQNLSQVDPSYRGDVWVVAEEQGGEIHPATFELIGKARDLADSLGVKVGTVLAGSGVADHARPLIEAGADTVHLLDDPRLSPFDPGFHRKVVSAAILRHEPQIVLFAATPQGRVLAPMVSYRCECGLTADCTGLDILDNTRRGEVGILHQTRPALGGNVMATICTRGSRSQMATARPGVMQRLPPDPARTGEVFHEPVDLQEDDRHMEILFTEVGTAHVNFDADVIVSGGRGLGSREAYERLVGDLSGALARRFGVTVERGASRAAVEEGFSDRSHQVGQTGTAVGPKIYVALGISGAIQHMIGVANSQTIVAVNRDPQAPILKQCDYYLVGSVEQIVPEVVRVLEGENP